MDNDKKGLVPKNEDQTLELRYKTYKKTFINLCNLKKLTGNILLGLMIFFGTLATYQFEEYIPYGMTICISLVAAYIFYILHSLYQYLREVSSTSEINLKQNEIDKLQILILEHEESILEHKGNLQHFTEKFGLIDIHDQRGEQAVQEKYRQLISTASNRIWAIGMTLTSVCQERDSLIEQVILKPNFDLVFYFWNPESSIQITKNGSIESVIHSITAQKALEEARSRVNDSTENWIGRIQDNIKDIIESVKLQKNIAHLKGENISGRVRIILGAYPAQFSCYVIDDNVFFYPILSKQVQTRHPTIHCLATSENGKGILGNNLVSHIEYLLNGNDDVHNSLRRVVYDSNFE